MRKGLHIAGAALTAAGLFALAGSTQAYSAPINPVTDSGRQAAAAAPANSVVSGSIKDGEVKSNDIGNQQIFGKHFTPAMISWFTTTWSNSVGEAQVKNGSLTMADVDKVFTQELKLGAFQSNWDLNANEIVIPNIGGSFNERATKIGSFPVYEAGGYTVNVNVQFDRLNADEVGYIAPTTDTRLMLALRETLTGSTPADSADWGTIGGNEISRPGFIPLNGSVSKPVTVDNIPEEPFPRTVDVYAFGENDDQSAFGSAADGKAPQFKVTDAQVSLIKVS